MKTIVVLSDLQLPYEDKRAVRNVLDFISKFQPDEVASVGDEVDFPQISRWTRGMEGEYRGDLQAHVDAAVTFFASLREAFPRGPINISRSNHGARPLNYVQKYAPGLMGLKSLTVESLLEYDRFGITYHHKPFELAPRWYLMHGDEGSLSRTPGGTALGLAKRIGASVVCGHSHAAGISHANLTVNSKTRTEIVGMEVGHLMDVRKAGYLRAGMSNWQQAVGLLRIDGRKVHPQLVLIQSDGSFVVDGRKFG